jgi:hypothetical protein
MVTLVVDETKLMGGINFNFPRPSAEPVLKIKVLFEMETILRPFSWHKFGQDRAKGLQKRAKNNIKWGSFTTCFLKACQVPAACVNL